MIEGAAERAVALAGEAYVDAGGNGDVKEVTLRILRLRGGVSGLDLCCTVAACTALAGYATGVGTVTVFGLA